MRFTCMCSWAASAGLLQHLALNQHPRRAWRYFAVAAHHEIPRCRPSELGRRLCAAPQNHCRNFSSWRAPAPELRIILGTLQRSQPRSQSQQLRRGERPHETRGELSTWTSYHALPRTIFRTPATPLGALIFPRADEIKIYKNRSPTPRRGHSGVWRPVMIDRKQIGQFPLSLAANAISMRDFCGMAELIQHEHIRDILRG